jgi:hypothetical protein
MLLFIMMKIHVKTYVVVYHDENVKIFTLTVVWLCKLLAVILVILGMLEMGARKPVDCVQVYVKHTYVHVN